MTSRSSWSRVSKCRKISRSRITSTAFASTSMSTVGLCRSRNLHLLVLMGYVARSPSGCSRLRLSSSLLLSLKSKIEGDEIGSYRPLSREIAVSKLDWHRPCSKQYRRCRPLSIDLFGRDEMIDQQFGHEDGCYCHTPRREQYYYSWCNHQPACSQAVNFVLRCPSHRDHDYDEILQEYRRRRAPVNFLSWRV